MNKAILPAGPGKIACAALGFALLVLNIIFVFIFPPIAFLGLALAIASLFYEGYRYVFVGYILTLLIGGGLLFLVLISICGNMHM